MSFQQHNTIRIATYNIQYDNKADTLNSWGKRKKMVSKLIQQYHLDLVGIQEPQLHQLDDLKNLLPGYQLIGTGDKGSVPILYSTEKLRQLDEGVIWLSSTPEIRSIGWDASMPRKFRWIHFEDLKTKKKFYLFNIHLDHLGTIARQEGIKVLLAHIPTISKGEPFVITGDFNSDQYSVVYQTVVAAGSIQDTRTIAARLIHPLWTTWNGYQTPPIPRKEQKRIDHIFVSKGSTIHRWELINKNYNKFYPSDHFPVFIDYEL